MKRRPLVTVGVISCNKLHYLKACVQSFRETNTYDNIEWIIVDNHSTEAGTREYIESLDFVDYKVFQEARNPTNEEAIAKNLMLEKASGDYLLMLLDDHQIVTRYDYLQEMMEIVDREGQGVTQVVQALQRRSRVAEESAIAVERGTSSGRQYYFMTGRPIVVGGCFAHMDLWRRFGRFMVDSTKFAGIEEEAIQRTRRWKHGRIKRCLQQVPISVPIVTDPRGYDVKIRGYQRIGMYEPPNAETGLYYRILERDEVQALKDRGGMAAIEDVLEAQPGIVLPINESGNWIKGGVAPEPVVDI